MPVLVRVRLQELCLLFFRGEAIVLERAPIEPEPVVPAKYFVDSVPAVPLEQVPHALVRLLALVVELVEQLAPEGCLERPLGRRVLNLHGPSPLYADRESPALVRDYIERACLGFCVAKDFVGDHALVAVAEFAHELTRVKCPALYVQVVTEQVNHHCLAALVLERQHAVADGVRRALVGERVVHVGDYIPFVKSDGGGVDALEEGFVRNAVGAGHVHHVAVHRVPLDLYLLALGLQVVVCEHLGLGPVKPLDCFRPLRWSELDGPLLHALKHRGHVKHALGACHAANGFALELLGAARDLFAEPLEVAARIRLEFPDCLGIARPKAHLPPSVLPQRGPAVLHALLGVLEPAHALALPVNGCLPALAPVLDSPQLAARVQVPKLLPGPGPLVVVRVVEAGRGPVEPADCIVELFLERLFPGEELLGADVGHAYVGLLVLGRDVAVRLPLRLERECGVVLFVCLGLFLGSALAHHFLKRFGCLVPFLDSGLDFFPDAEARPHAPLHEARERVGPGEAQLLDGLFVVGQVVERVNPVFCERVLDPRLLVLDVGVVQHSRDLAVNWQAPPHVLGAPAELPREPLGVPGGGPAPVLVDEVPQCREGCVDLGPLVPVGVGFYLVNIWPHDAEQLLPVPATQAFFLLGESGLKHGGVQLAKDFCELRRVPGACLLIVGDELLCCPIVFVRVGIWHELREIPEITICCPAALGGAQCPEAALYLFFCFAVRDLINLPSQLGVLVAVPLGRLAVVVDNVLCLLKAAPCAPVRVKVNARAQVGEHFVRRLDRVPAAHVFHAVARQRLAHAVVRALWHLVRVPLLELLECVPLLVPDGLLDLQHHLGRLPVRLLDFGVLAPEQHVPKALARQRVLKRQKALVVPLASRAKEALHLFRRVLKALLPHEHGKLLCHRRQFLRPVNRADILRGKLLLKSLPPLPRQALELVARPVREEFDQPLNVLLLHRLNPVKRNPRPLGEALVRGVVCHARIRLVAHDVLLHVVEDCHLFPRRPRGQHPANPQDHVGAPLRALVKIVPVLPRDALERVKVFRGRQLVHAPPDCCVGVRRQLRNPFVAVGLKLFRQLPHEAPALCLLPRRLYELELFVVALDKQVAEVLAPKRLVNRPYALVAPLPRKLHQCVEVRAGVAPCPLAGSLQ